MAREGMTGRLVAVALGLSVAAAPAACARTKYPPLVYTAAPEPAKPAAATGTARPTGRGLEPKSPFETGTGTGTGAETGTAVVAAGFPASLPAPDLARVRRAEADDLVVKAVVELHEGRLVAARATLADAFAHDPTLGNLEHAIVVGSVEDEYQLVNLIPCGKARKGHYDVRAQALTKTPDGHWADRLTLGCKYDPEDGRVLFFDVSSFFGRF